MRILLIEDEPAIADFIERGLVAEGYEVRATRDGIEGARSAQEDFDLIVLDVMLPGRDGFEVLKALRKRSLRVPVLILTARDAIEDRVVGLDHGADDYLVKPFAFAELLARIRALLRRGRVDQALCLKAVDIEIDIVTRRAVRAHHVLALTAREFELLEYLVRHQNSIVSREMLARDVWKEPSRGTPLDNVIDVHMAHLRRKVDQDFPVRLIHTVRGVGFILQEGEP